MGKWQCPSCRQENVSPEETKDTDSISRQARTKITDGKSKMENKSSVILGKKNSSGKGKSSMSRKKMDSVEAGSSFVKMNIDNKKETKSVSPVKDGMDSKMQDGDEQPQLLEGALKKDRKRKRKVDNNIEGRKKKPKTSKVEGGGGSERKQRSKTSSSRGSSEPKQKLKSSKSKKDNGLETLDIQLKDEVIFFICSCFEATHILSLRFIS